MLLSLIVAAYIFQIIMNKIASWKRSKNQVSMRKPEQGEHKIDVHNINNIALNPKVINLKLLCVVILFSAGNYILYRFYGSASWYRNLIKSGLDRLLFAFIVQSFIYMKNHKVRRFVMEEMIQPIMINPFLRYGR